MDYSLRYGSEVQGSDIPALLSPSRFVPTRTAGAGRNQPLRLCVVRAAIPRPPSKKIVLFNFFSDMKRFYHFGTIRIQFRARPCQSFPSFFQILLKLLGRH